LKGIAGHAIAAEGAASNYFPGAYGTLLVGVAPEPGPVFVDLNLYYSAEVDRAVLQGRANANVEIKAFYTLLGGYYFWDAPAIGGRFGVGGYVPLGYSSLEASLTSALGSISVDEDSFGLGDIGFVPASFFWSAGNFNLNLYELVIAPTGKYDVSESVNIGRNYWSFDTVVAATWFNAETGTEISVIPGLMINTENPDTDYRTGTEFHVDAVVNQFLSETFAVGVVGYAYKQIEGDSGSGAILGDFKGESYGLGPALSWVPEFGDGNLAITGGWLHDLHATNRLEADYGSLTIAVSF
jgi:hypothetical protein